MLYLNPAIPDSHTVKCLFEHAQSFSVPKPSVKVITDGVAPVGLEYLRIILGLFPMQMVQEPQEMRG